MTDKNFMRVEDVARELEEKGFIMISGRINRQYFLERTCYSGSSGIDERK